MQCNETLNRDEEWCQSRPQNGADWCWQAQDCRRKVTLFLREPLVANLGRQAGYEGGTNATEGLANNCHPVPNGWISKVPKTWQK